MDAASMILGMGIGGGGTSDYEKLSNLPSIGGTTLKGALNASEIGALPSDTAIPAKTSDLTNDADFQSGTQVQAAINATVSGLYKPGGSATLATLPPLVAANSGYVYDMTEAFTTTADFKEGPGNQYPAGTNVVIADVGGGAYKYDALSGILNGYVQKDGDKVLSENDYTTADKSKLDGIAAGATANVAATAAPLMDGAAAVGDSVKYARENHVHPTDTSRASAADVADLQAECALLRELIAGVDAPIYLTASGNPATFSDGYAANVRNLAVTITPTQSGSGDPSPSNVRPISGVSSVAVTRTGKNLLPHTFTGLIWNGVTITANADGSLTYNGTCTETFTTAYCQDTVTRPLFASLMGRSVVFSMEWSGAWSGVNKSPGIAIQGPITPGIGYGINSETPSITLTIANASGTCQFFIGITEGSTMTDFTLRPMLRLASDTDAAWEPYQSESVTVPLVDSNSNPLTVYGGTLDVTAGTLSVTWANIASYNGETLPGRWISDRDVYAAGTSPTTGAQVVYELATPVTYTLAAQSLSTLSGYNCVSATGGSVAVEYRADTSVILGG